MQLHFARGLHASSDRLATELGIGNALFSSLDFATAAVAFKDAHWQCVLIHIVPTACLRSAHGWHCTLLQMRRVVLHVQITERIANANLLGYSSSHDSTKCSIAAHSLTPQHDCSM